MKKVISLVSIGKIKSNEFYRLCRSKKVKTKIRNNPKRKGRVYND